MPHKRQKQKIDQVAAEQNITSDGVTSREALLKNLKALAESDIPRLFVTRKDGTSVAIGPPYIIGGDQIQGCCDAATKKSLTFRFDEMACTRFR
jgi:hypothetical protein